MVEYAHREFRLQPYAGQQAEPSSDRKAASPVPRSAKAPLVWLGSANCGNLNAVWVGSLRAMKYQEARIELINTDRTDKIKRNR